MTTGQLLFYGGVALLVLTVILAVIFIIAKPKYVPQTAAYGGSDPGGTQRLRNGYPTDRVTVRRESSQPSAPAAGTLKETELFTGELTELIPPPDSDGRR